MNRKAVILPVVLFVLLLLGLFAAMFSFRVHADVATVQAIADRMQTRLAAEAGVDAVKLLLRVSRNDPKVWYHNPDLFHRVLVWAHDTDSKVSGTTQELEEPMAFRFSIVADDPTEFEKYVRFGVTDEASKLNVNTATPEQLLRLLESTLTAAGEGEEETDPKAIVDAIVDWRDADNKPTGEAGDTEGDYYMALDRPYAVRNGPFSSVDELLLVKGVTGRVLYGEDFDRNGLLTPNEDDGDDSFPPDNQDGKLDQGLFPYLTAMSHETNVSNDNQPRVYLFSDETKLKTDLETVFPDRPDAVSFIVAVTRRGPGTGDGGTPGKPGSKPPTPTPPAPGPGTQPPGSPTVPSGQRPPPGQPAQPGVQPPPRRPGGAPPRQPTLPPVGPKPAPKKQRQTPGQTPPTQGTPRSGTPRRPGGTPRTPTSPGSQPGAPSQPPTAPAETGGGDEGGTPGETGAENPDGENPPGEEGSGDEQGVSTPIRSPASLLRPRNFGGQEEPSPLTVADLPLLMDRLTTRPADQREVTGLVNVNTAGRNVLRCLGGLKDEQIDTIIAARAGLDTETLATPAWLMTEGLLDLDTFDSIAASITARGQQFTIESLGYGDHVGMVTRLQVVVDMVGPIAQTVYYRDLSYLGASYPIREKDKEQVRGR